MTTLSIDNYINSFNPNSWSKFLPTEYIAASKSISAGVRDALNFLEVNKVRVENFANVESYLIDNSEVVAYIYDIPQKTSEYFNNARPKFEVFSDPDSESPSELFLEIETDLSPEEANKNLSRINREWLLNSKDQNLLSFNISLKFI